MSHPCLAFCPYLPLNRVIEFANWRIGPFDALEDSWADPKFKAQAVAFLAKFVDDRGEWIIRPSVLCRRDGKIDGEPPASEEIEALEAAVGFAFLDQNPRNSEHSRHRSWAVLTADNTELCVWPIDVESGNVTVTTGLMVRTLEGGYQIADPKLIIRPPLDLHMPLGVCAADCVCLEAVYTIVLESMQSPGANPQADRLRTAIGWFVKAWRNTATVRFPERLVFLKTAFEALTGTSKSHESARILRTLFEALPDTNRADSELLLWSPEELPVRIRTYSKNGRQHCDQVTDLELWFMAFGDARNTIIHQGIVPSLIYAGPNPEYDGHFVFTAEFLLRAAVKVSLASFGYPDLWRSDVWRALKAAYEIVECDRQEQIQAPRGQD